MQSGTYLLVAKCTSAQTPRTTVKHGDGGVIIWAHFAAIVFQTTPESRVRPYVRQRNLGQNWVMQQDNDPKHISKMAEIENTLQSPDLDMTEMLWPDLKRAVCEQMPANLNELKQCCNDEWGKSLQQQCEKRMKHENDYFMLLLLKVILQGSES